MLTVLELDERNQRIRLSARDGEDWQEAIARRRERHPGWAVELYVMPANAPATTRDRRGRKLQPVAITVHTWAPDGTVTVEPLSVEL